MVRTVNSTGRGRCGEKGKENNSSAVGGKKEKAKKKKKKKTCPYHRETRQRENRKEKRWRWATKGGKTRFPKGLLFPVINTQGFRGGQCRLYLEEKKRRGNKGQSTTKGLEVREGGRGKAMGGGLAPQQLAGGPQEARKGLWPSQLGYCGQWGRGEKKGNILMKPQNERRKKGGE